MSVGREGVSGYLGEDRETWKRYDASELVKNAAFKVRRRILIDQGLADNFLATQLHPALFERRKAEGRR